MNLQVRLSANSNLSVAPAIDVLNATDVEVATHKSEEKQWLHDVKRKEECFKIVEESSKKLNVN